MSDNFVCVECGEIYGRATEDANAVWSLGDCSVCHAEDVIVTEDRNFGGLNDNWRNHDE